MSSLRAEDDARTEHMLRDIRHHIAAGEPLGPFGDLIEASLVEGFAGRYDGTYPPAGHTYPEARP